MITCFAKFLYVRIRAYSGSPGCDGQGIALKNLRHVYYTFLALLQGYLGHQFYSGNNSKFSKVLKENL